MPDLIHVWAEPDLYLLANEDLVASCEGVTRKVCPIQKEPEPVIFPEKPWEGVGPDGRVTSLQDPFYGTVLYDPERRLFRCWYNAYDRFQNRVCAPPHGSQGYSCCYAESPDGIHWEKPVVGEVLHDESLENNLVRFREDAADGTSSLGEQVWNVLPYSSPGSEDRFVASLYTHYSDPLFPTGITFCYSPDGLRWRMRYPPPLMLEGDCHGFAWDPLQRCYILTTRSHQHMNLCRRWGRPWKRHIAMTRSRDLIHWTAMETVLEVDERDPEDAQLYLMYVIPYGHAYLGELLMFYAHEMVLDTQLALSRDLRSWQRVGDRRPILERGEKGSWDCRHVALTHNPPHPEGGRMRFWFGGKNTPHYQAGYGALGTGTLRRDGFVCLEAGEEEGIVNTIPFRPPRPNSACWIILNVDASEGEVLVEVTDVDGHPLDRVTKADCEPIRGDNTRALVNFPATPGNFFDRGNFLRFAQDIRLRFYLRNARLYAFKLSNYSPVWPQKD